MEVTPTTTGIFLPQPKYKKDLIDMVPMTGVNPFDTSMELAAKYNKNGGEPVSDLFLYRTLVGHLIYLNKN